MATTNEISVFVRSSHHVLPSPAATLVGLELLYVSVVMTLAAIFSFLAFVRLCRALVRVVLRGFGLVLVFAMSPFWVLFALLWPARLSGSGVSYPPRASEFDGELLEGGLFEVNVPGEVGVRRTPVSGHLHAPRLRSRAVWVRRFEAILGEAPGVVGAFVRGRWVPDLPDHERSTAANFILTGQENGAKILGGGSVQTLVEGRGGIEIYYHVELADGSREVVFPELLSKLSSYALLRQRNADLLSALRLRALEWCRGHGLSGPAAYMAVVSAIKLAWHVSPSERRLRESVIGETPTLLTSPS